MDHLQTARQLQRAELKLREFFEALKREAARLMETETARAELSVGEGI